MTLYFSRKIKSLYLNVVIVADDTAVQKWSHDHRAIVDWLTAVTTCDTDV